MHNLSPADEMCALTVRSEMNIRFAISALVYPSAARTTASRSRSGRASSMARASSRRDCGCCMFRSLMSCRWLDGLNCGRPSHTSVMRRMMSSGASVFGDKTLGACLDGPLHGPARTQGRQYQHMRRLRKCAQSSCRLDAVHAGHGYIHQHHIRMMPAGLVDRLTAIGAGENDIEPAGGIIFENQPHGLANHRIVINHANRYRPVIAVLFAAHSTHGSCTSTWNACRASKPNRHVPPACRTRSANPGNPAPVRKAFLESMAGRVASADAAGTDGLVGLDTCACTPTVGFTVSSTDTGAPGA